MAALAILAAYVLVGAAALVLGLAAIWGGRR